MFEGVKNVAEKITQGAKEMRKKFSEKFENAKKELADKIMGAKSPEDMIALGKKLQEQGEILKAEEAGVKQEELSEDQDEAIEMNTAFDKDKAHGEALEMNAEFKKDKDHEEALGINKEIDEAKAAEAKAQEQAKFAEEVRLSAEADAKKAALLLEKIQSGNLTSEIKSTENAEPVKQESAERIDSLSLEKLTKLFNARNRGNFDAEAEKAWSDCSNEIATNLNNIADITEAHFYLTNEGKTIAEKKWDELSDGEVAGATSEEQMLIAVKNIRNGGHEKPLALKALAFKKFPDLSKQFPKN